jgi:DNA-binding NarL/FixJ family response regulator
VTIRVLLADDEGLVRGGLRAIIGAEGDIEVVGEAADGSRVGPLVRRLEPDVVLMDIRMPEVDGIEATRQVTAMTTATPVRVIVLTTFEHDDLVYEALRAGASGFLLKRARPEEMLHAIRVVASGDSLLFPAAIRDLAARLPGPRANPVSAALTGREQEILRLMAAGLSNGEISQRLYVGVETVKTHVRSILRKLGARGRTQAVIIAYESGFVSPRAG